MRKWSWIWNKCLNLMQSKVDKNNTKETQVTLHVAKRKERENERGNRACKEHPYASAWWHILCHSISVNRSAQLGASCNWNWDNWPHPLHQSYTYSKEKSGLSFALSQHERRKWEREGKNKQILFGHFTQYTKVSEWVSQCFLLLPNGLLTLCPLNQEAHFISDSLNLPFAEEAKWKSSKLPSPLSSFSLLNQS